jgi:predicted Mrr-cat superfamily restriction endonuclease
MIDLFRAESFVGIDVSIVPNLESLTQQDIVETLVNDGVLPGKAIGLASMLLALARRMRPQDIVITPGEASAEFLVGLVNGPYEHAPNRDCAHRRAVRWLGSLVRAEIPEAFRPTLGSPMPVYQPGAQSGLRTLVDEKWRLDRGAGEPSSSQGTVG